MESPLVDDDICILKHETAYVAESPVAVCSGDESVASHFALVTAYEDIKKRLRDTERENTLLRKRVKQLEDKLFRPEAPPSEGPQYMNKAFSAYRGIYMEKKDLQAELNKLKKERVEAERMLQEQLQSKELEILQLRSELETSQVMKSLNETQDYWQVERSSSSCSTDVHLQEEVERLRLENIHLHQLCTSTSQGISDLSSDVQSEDSQEGAPNCRSVAAAGVMRSYEELCSEMSRLRSLLSDQSQLMKKLRDKPLPPVLRRAASALPVQCLDDVQKNSSPVRVTAPRPPSAPPLPSSVGRPTAAEGLQESSWKSTWPLQRPAPLGSPAGPSTPLSHSSPSLEDGSWSIPSHPRPSDALFWEGPKSSGSSSDWARPY